MTWPVPLPAPTGDEATDLAAFLAWEQDRERHYHPDRFSTADGARRPEPFTYYLGVPEASWLNHGDGVPKFVTAPRVARYRTRTHHWPPVPDTARRWPVRAKSPYGLDCGAFMALTGSNKNVPFFEDDDTYGGMVARWVDNNDRMPDFCAPRDMPCEESVRGNTGLTVRDHQELSCDSYEWLEREYPWLPWIPVLQGDRPKDYRVHERMYLDRGVNLAGAHRVGVGSICRRGHVPEIVDLVEEFAESGYQLHGFGIKVTALPLIGHLLRSADSMAWSFDARYSKIRLPDCTHAGDTCANCYRYAVAWRERVLASLTNLRKEIPMPTTAVRLDAAGFDVLGSIIRDNGGKAALPLDVPKIAKLVDASMLDGQGRVTALGKDTASRHRYTGLRGGLIRDAIEAYTPPAPIELPSDLAEFAAMVCTDLGLTATQAPDLGDWKAGQMVTWTNATGQPVRTTITEKMLTPAGLDVGWDVTIPYQALRLAEHEMVLDLAAEGTYIVGCAPGGWQCWELAMPVDAQRAAIEFEGAHLTKVGVTVTTEERNKLVEQARVLAEQAAGQVAQAGVAEPQPSAPARAKPATRTKTRRTNPAPPPDLFTGMADFAAMVCSDLGITTTSGPRTIPMADAEWGMFGTVKGYGPCGDRCTETGYITQPPRISTTGFSSIGQNRKRVSDQLLHFTIVLPHSPGQRDGRHVGMYAEMDAVFTVLPAPADRPLNVKKSLSFRCPIVDLRRGDVFYIWNEPGTVVAADPVTGERPDIRTRYHLQADPGPILDGDCHLQVLVDGAGEPVTKPWAAGLYVDVEDPRKRPWRSALPETTAAPMRLATGFVPVGTSHDALRDVLCRSSYSGTVLILPPETLPKPVWQELHAMLLGMGATGGSRKGQPYFFQTDRRADLVAFIHGGPVPKHERVTAGWVRTPDALAAKVVAQFAEMNTLPRPLRVLEPSAGDGSLAQAVLAADPEALMTAVEPVEGRAAALIRTPGMDVVEQCTLEEYAIDHAHLGLDRFDLVVMNPPFSVPGNRTIWADHVRLAWGMLADGGRLVAILPGCLDRNTSRPAAEVLDLLGPDVVVEALPARSFRENGTDFDTCVVAATKLSGGVATARRRYAKSLYRRADGEPVRVSEPTLTAAAAKATPVQAYRNWGGECVARYVGVCIGCGVSTWSDGDNDPRGMLGMNASAALLAEELDMQGPDVCRCWACNDSPIMRRRTEDKARTLWTRPEVVVQEPMLFDLDGLGEAVAAALANE